MLGPGTIVADKYRLVRVIGRGGMGMVVEATHVQLGTAFALKFLYKSIIANASLAERFLREARATAGLKSEHVCRVFDVGKFDGVPYLVMERLEGTDLAKLLRAEVRLPPARACEYLMQACAGIVEAHAAQIVHRDLKPGNLFVTRRADDTPLIKVLDFGVAKAPPEDSELTGTNTILGSPSYMSPEQLRSSKQVDARSDIWSLGVILFELVSGRKPFAGDGVAEIAVKIATAAPPRLPDGPAELDAVIARCLERAPADRYQNVGELAQALAPFAEEPARRLAPIIARASTAGGAPAAAPAEAAAEAPATAASASVTPSTAPLQPLPAAAAPSLALSARTTAPRAAAAPSPAPVSAGAPLSALAGAPLSMLVTVPIALRQTEPIPRLESPAAASGVLELGPPPLPRHDPATTMQSAGVIEGAAAPRGPRARAGVIVLSAGTVLGVSLAIMASQDEGPRSPATVRVQYPAPADAAAPPAPPVERPEPPVAPRPALPEPRPTLPEPASIADAAVPAGAGAPADAAAPADAGASADAAAASDDPAIEVDPPAPAPAPPPPKRRPPAPKAPSTRELGKSRI